MDGKRTYERSAVVVEYLRHTVPPDRAEEFERAYRQAGQVMDADSHCLRWEMARGGEEPEHFVVRIEWDSVEGHQQGLQASARFGEFFAAVRPFFSAIEEMTHYQVRPTGAGHCPTRAQARPNWPPRGAWHAMSAAQPVRLRRTDDDRRADRDALAGRRRGANSGRARAH